ncbi:MAG: glycosyltransferase family 2 protein [Candidatus Promineifilaceae bacterium]
MSSRNNPRITFGIILLNGLPFIRYNLRALYPFAHEIIVVEGAVPGARAIATPDGHSIDGSLDELYRFRTEEDPHGKVQIVTKDGFWTEKDAMSQAYAERATGDYLWQVDIDEFYQPHDMQELIRRLGANPQLSAVFFKQISFWGGFDYVVDGWYLRQAQYQGPGIVPRVFRWRPDHRYYSHRPVTVVDGQANDLGRMNPLNGRDLADQGIFMYHYSLLFPKQVSEKATYYSRADWAAASKSEQWSDEVYGKLKQPFRVHNVYRYPSWLERFEGRHPPQIEAMRRDIENGTTKVTLRPTADIEQLLGQPAYRLGRLGLKIMDPFARWAIQTRRGLRRASLRL